MRSPTCRSALKKALLNQREPVPASAARATRQQPTCTADMQQAQPHDVITRAQGVSHICAHTVRPSFLGLPVTSFFTSKSHTVNGEPYSLDDIENNVLRKLGEPRIHFAINCASQSCPVLRPKAYRAEELDQQLDEQAITFVNDPTRNRFDVATDQASLSKIFDWFKGDFDAVGGVPSFLSPFATGDAKMVLESNALQIDYLPYNWGLNRAQ